LDSISALTTFPADAADQIVAAVRKRITARPSGLVRNLRAMKVSAARKRVEIRRGRK
jgi:hypothetical protein